MSFSDKSGNAATRMAIDLMVTHAERQTRSRDVAYEVVAEKISMSSSWVKKCVLSDDFVRRVRPSLMLNIKSAYDRLCESIEREHRNEIKKLAFIKEEISAATAGLVGSVQHEKSTTAVRAHPSRFATAGAQVTQ